MWCLSRRTGMKEDRPLLPSSQEVVKHRQANIREREQIVSRIQMQKHSSHNSLKISTSILQTTSPVSTTSAHQDPCLLLNCQFGSSCVILEDGLPRCSCFINCSVEGTSILEKLDETSIASSNGVTDITVCGSDLKIYPSLCEMRRQACKTQIELRPRPLELCEGGLT